MDDRWDRRCFIKRLGAAGALVAGTTTVGMLAHEDGQVLVQHTRPKQIRDFTIGLDLDKPLLAMATGDPTSATQGVIESLGGMKQFVHPGEVVVIKPNVGWDRAPIHAANTNPQVVGTLVKLCLQAGAARVIVTDNSCNEARRCFTRSGIWKATESAGGEVFLPAKHRFKEYDLGGVILGRMPVLMPVLSADRLINVPVAKHHTLSGFTGAMKNLYGVLGGRRNRLHQRINDSIADLADFARATLTVMDATRVLVRNGPQGGNIADTLDVGQVIASTDPVAVDAYSCTLIGQKPENLPYIDLAEKRGLGTSDLSKIEKRKVS